MVLTAIVTIVAGVFVMHLNGVLSHQSCFAGILGGKTCTGVIGSSMDFAITHIGVFESISLGIVPSVLTLFILLGLAFLNAFVFLAPRAVSFGYTSRFAEENIFSNTYKRLRWISIREKRDPSSAHAARQISRN